MPLLLTPSYCSWHVQRVVVVVEQLLAADGKKTSRPPIITETHIAPLLLCSKPWGPTTLQVVEGDEGAASEGGAEASLLLSPCSALVFVSEPVGRTDEVPVGVGA